MQLLVGREQKKFLMNKNEMRSILLKKRREINLKKQRDAEIKEKVLKLLHPFNNIGIYVSLPEEVDTLEIIEALLPTKNISVGKIVNGRLSFFKIKSLTELKVGHFKVLEPITDDYSEKDSLEIMVIPLLGFDSSFNRLGYGKGYYDRYLYDFYGLKVGLAYNTQKVIKIPTETTDVALDFVVCDTI